MRAATRTYTLLSALTILLLLPFLYAMTMLFPEADDFGRAHAAQGLFDFSSGLAVIIPSWLHESGRYFHHFLVYFLGDAATSRLAYSTMCIGLQVLNGAALYGIFSTISRQGSRCIPLFMALFSLLAIQCGHGSYDLTFTLLTDVLGIGIGNTLVLVYIFLLTRVWFCTSGSFVALCGLTLVTAFITSGCYEHSALAIVAVSVLAFGLAVLYAHPHRRVFGLFLLGSFVSLLCSLFAPGNFKRSAKMSPELFQLEYIVKEWFRYGFGMFSPVYLMTALTLTALLQPRWRSGPDARYGSAPVLSLGLLGICLFSFGICLLHVLGGYRLEWASKLSASIGLLGSYGLVFIAFCLWDTLHRLLARIPLPLVPVLALCVLVSSPNMRAILIDVLGGNVANYTLQQQNQQRVLNRGAGGDLVLDRMEQIPFPMWSYREMTWLALENAETWPNPYQAALYGYDNIVRLPVFAAYAYASLRGNLPQSAETQPLPPPLKDCALVLNVAGNTAETSRRDWLLIRSDAPLPAPVQVVVIEEAGKHRLLPKVVQRALADLYLNRERADYALPIRLAGLSRTLVTFHWQVTGPPDYQYMLPLRAASSRGIRAVFVGWGGTVWKVYAAK